MGVVVKRYIDILAISLYTPIVLALLQQHPYILVHFLFFCFVLVVIFVQYSKSYSQSS